MDEFIYLGLIALSAGLVKGLTGFGSSLVAIPLLLMLYPNQDFVIITTILISSNVILNFLLMFENNAFSIKSLEKVYVITITGVAFTFVGLLLLTRVNEATISNIAASLILFAVVVKAYQLFATKSFKIKENKALQFLVGAISGMGNGFGSIDGPPIVFYLSGIGADKKQFKNTMASHSLVMGVMGVFIFLITGNYSMYVLPRIGIFVLLASFGVLGGMMVSKRINDRTFQIIVLVILVMLDIKMIFF
jgi:hypothetical protein